MAAHAVTSSAAFCVVPYEALTVTGVDAATRRVTIENVADVVPPVTVTESGTAATFVSLLARTMTAPPAGAGPPSVTVPFVTEPPSTGLGAIAREVRTELCPTMERLAL
jgi:hypothetical protein